MAEPKRHHYNAEMLSRRFTDADGVLFFFNKAIPEKGVLPSTPKDVFVRNNLYAWIDRATGAKDLTLERQYARMEGRANQIIEKIVSAARRDKTPGLTVEERREWDAFVYHQWKRVPEAWEDYDFSAALQEQVAEFERTVRPLTDEERARLQDRRVLARLEQNSRVEALASSSIPVANVQASRGIGIIWITDPKKAFVLGSRPVVKLTPRGVTHLADHRVEMWLPIASDVAISPGGPPGTERVMPTDDHGAIRHLNEATAQQSGIIAGRSKALIASLMRRK
jgi:hypothetical protein